jgi:hypothetical protein
MTKAKPLTVKRIEQLKDPGRYLDKGNRGLYLQVTDTGTSKLATRPS